MLHKIPLEGLGANGESMRRTVETCVHCGFCLPTCPTYITMGEEVDSPRGRIVLMKEVLEGTVDLKEAQPYIDHCLGCMSCVSSCPSGVQYGDLLTPFRAYAEKKRRDSLASRVMRVLVLATLPHPKRFRVLARIMQLTRLFACLAPRSFGVPLALLPKKLPNPKPLPETYPARGERRAQVALLAGCAQQVLAPEINWATLRVLSENGVETIIPKSQSCCGALAMHVGAQQAARKTARDNLTAFEGEFDAVVTNAAGCGSGMHEYPLLFKGEHDESIARELSRRVKDISAFLSELGLKPPPPLPRPLKVVYHDACHLAHVQGIRAEPRALLEAIPNVTLVEPPEWEICCGSAGTYNIEQPETAAKLGERKARNLGATGADAVATGNIGCMTQIRNHLEAQSVNMPVRHTVEILADAYAQNGGLRV